MRGVVYLLFVWVLVLSLASVGQYVQLNRSRVAARQDDRAVWRAVVCTIEAAELKNPKVSASQQAQDIKFWTSLLVDKVGTTPCD